MEIKVGRLRIFYDRKGRKGNRKLLFLHCWSLRRDRIRCQRLTDLLAKNYEVVSLDFPGFGDSDPPPKPWTVENYSDFVVAFLEKLRIKPCVFAGHSFGGRVAIKTANKYPKIVTEIILIDSSGIERKSLKVKLAIFLSNLAPRCLKELFNHSLGSKNFREAVGVMRETLRLVVAGNLEEEIRSINKKTLIIWGENDKTTPLRHGELMHDWIKGSKIIVVKGANHGLPWQKPERVAEEMSKFLSNGE